jgi:hypothetical protein
MDVWEPDQRPKNGHGNQNLVQQKVAPKPEIGGFGVGLVGIEQGLVYAIAPNEHDPS